MPRLNDFLPGCKRAARAVFLVVTLLAAIPGSAQIIQEWTQKSLSGDSSTPGETSAAVGMDPNYMFAVDNEHEKLRLFARFPGTSCPNPVYTFDVRSSLSLPDSREVDMEAMLLANVGGTNRIYWLGSHSNSKDGEIRPSRYRLFATRVTNTGVPASPYTLTYLGRYDSLRTDICHWDRTNGHGFGSNYFGLMTSTNAGIAAEDINGFNMEGLCFAPDGTTAYLCFRTPLVNGSGPTTSNSQRTNALVIPLLNIHDLVTNNPVAGPGKAKFGTPFTLNLGHRGIRSMDSSYPGNYLITAGPPGDPGAPPANFRLYTWSGVAGHAPIERLTTIPDGYTPEGAILPATAISSNTVVQFVSDDDDDCWRSFTAYAGNPNQPILQMLSPSNGVARLNLFGQLAQTYTVEYSASLTQWSTLRAVVCTNNPTPVTDAGATNPMRIYRTRQ